MVEASDGFVVEVGKHDREEIANIPPVRGRWVSASKLNTQFVLLYRIARDVIKESVNVGLIDAVQSEAVVVGEVRYLITGCEKLLSPFIEIENPKVSLAARPRVAPWCLTVMTASGSTFSSKVMMAPYDSACSIGAGVQSWMNLWSSYSQRK